MKTLLIAIITLTSFSFASAQSTVTWIGGTPGKETSWDEPRNWSNHRVPNVYSNVLIEDVSTSTFSFPEITEGIVEVNSLRITSSAKLSIGHEAQLVIFGYSEGLIKDNVQLEGSLFVFHNDANDITEVVNLDQ